MPTSRKIPKKDAKVGAVAIGYWAIFCKSILMAAKIADKLNRAEKRSRKTRKHVPLAGYVQYDGRKISYIRYGFVDDKSFYAK